MDRKAWIVVVLCIALLGLWQWTYMKYYTPTPEQRAARAAEAAKVVMAQSQTDDESASTPVPTATPVSAATPEAASLDTSKKELVPVEREVFTISTKAAAFHFVNDFAGVERVELFGHLGENGSNVVLNIPEALPIGALGKEPGVALGGFGKVASESANEVAFERMGNDGVVIRKKYIVEEGKDGEGTYVVNMELTFTNSGIDAQEVGELFVSTGGAAPVHYRDMPIYTGFDWYREGKAKFIDVNWFNARSIPLVGIELSEASSFYRQETDNIAWAGVKNQYFVNMVAVKEGAMGTEAWARRVNLIHAGNDEHKVLGIEGALGLPGFRLEAGKSQSWTLQIYTGPKELQRLTQLGGGEQAIMNFGIFKWVSIILLYSMNALYGVLGSYAAAIIVLTIIIKALLWPMQNKATNSMRRMAALSPKMAELREKYKDDPTRMNQELMKLYKDYGVNPLSGCLPMLIQIPIFFGFYSMLGTAIELRNSSFLWVRDLSQPDTVGHIMGFPVNILPLLMAASMIWQMKITPKTGDAAQQRMFMFMPLIFILFAYNFASALSLYWTTQNIISVIQLYATRNRPLPKLEKKSVTQKKALEELRGKKRK